jgi:restriction endonuclease S subunit
VINPESGEPKALFGKSDFTYIDISSVDNQGGTVNFDNSIPSDEAPSRARRIVRNDDILLSTVRPNLKAFAFLEKLPDKVLASTGFAVLRPKNTELLSRFLYHLVLSDLCVDQMIGMMGKGAYPSVNQTDVANIEIPLPPLDVQEALVAELERYRKQIEGARAIVSNYKPEIEIDPTWEMRELGEVCEVKGGKRLPMGSDYSTTTTKHAYLRVVDFRDGSIDLSDLKYISDKVQNEISRYTISSKDVYISIAGTIGLTGVIPESLHGANLTENAAKIVITSPSILSHSYLAKVMQSTIVQDQIRSLTFAVGVPKLALERIKTLSIPIPPVAAQQAIVTRLESERAEMEMLRGMIVRLEAKIKSKVAALWG